MNYTRNAAVLLGTAFLTALLAAPLLGPASARATDAGTPATPAVVHPTLEAGGITFTLEPDKATYAAGEKPRLALTAQAGEKAGWARVHVLMATVRPGLPMSRIGPIPRETFAKTVTFELEPKEKKALQLATDTPLLAGSTFTVQLVSGAKRVSSSTFAVPAATTTGRTIVAPFPGAAVQATPRRVAPVAATPPAQSR